MTDVLAAGLPVADLTESERRLWAAFARGELADLRAGDTEADDPRKAETWDASRRVRAEVVAALWLGAVNAAAGRVPRVRLAGALVEGSVDVRGGIINCPVEMTGCCFAGAVLLAEARTRTIDLSGSVLGTMDAAAAEFTGQLVLQQCQAAKVSLDRAHISGNLVFTGAKLVNPGGAALAADQITVDGNVYCGEGFQAEGEVQLAGAHIGGQLDLTGAKLVSPGGAALAADGITVDSSVYCGEGFQAEGEVQLPGAQIDGELVLTGAKLVSPGGAALTADQITVDSSVHCGEGFKAEGEVRLAGAHIGGQLAFSGASLRVNLTLHSLQAASLWLNDMAAVGTVNLVSTHVKELYDTADRWPSQMYLDGFIYESLQPYAEARGTCGRLAWLAHAESSYRAQPYEQLAAYYRRLGHDEEARRVLLAKQRRRRDTLGPVGKLTGYLLDGIVGYGYRPARAFAWLVVLLAAGSVYFAINRPAPVNPAQHLHYQPVLYTADLLIPLVNLGQSNIWAPAGAASGSPLPSSAWAGCW